MISGFVMYTSLMRRRHNILLSAALMHRHRSFTMQEHLRWTSHLKWLQDKQVFLVFQHGMRQFNVSTPCYHS